MRNRYEKLLDTLKKNDSKVEQIISATHSHIPPLEISKNELNIGLLANANWIYHDNTIHEYERDFLSKFNALAQFITSNANDLNLQVVPLASLIKPGFVKSKVAALEAENYKLLDTVLTAAQLFLQALKNAVAYLKKHYIDENQLRSRIIQERIDLILQVGSQSQKQLNAIQSHFEKNKHKISSCWNTKKIQFIIDLKSQKPEAVMAQFHVQHQTPEKRSEKSRPSCFNWFCCFKPKRRLELNVNDDFESYPLLWK